MRFPRATHLVCAFEKQEDAQRFYEVLGKRLGKFGLELSSEKTRIIGFSSTDRPGKTSFDFLGFEFRWGKDRSGKPHVALRTSSKKLRSSLKSFNEWCKKNRHKRLAELFKTLNAKLRGYFNYYGVIGNYVSLQLFFDKAIRMLFRHLNQRSQRRSYNWNGFHQLIEQFGIVKPHIVERPKRRNVMSLKPETA